jgi:hypothetical protein
MEAGVFQALVAVSFFLSFNFTGAFLKEAIAGATIDGKRARKVRNRKGLADFLEVGVPCSSGHSEHWVPPGQEEVGKKTFGHFQSTSLPSILVADAVKVPASIQH